MHEHSREENLSSLIAKKMHFLKMYTWWIVATWLSLLASAYNVDHKWTSI